MRIEELHIENFRGFKELTVKFPADLAVLIGTNGSGKSSILECIAILLAQFEHRLTQSREKPQIDLTDQDINVGSTRSMSRLTVVTESQETLTWSIERTLEPQSQYLEMDSYVHQLHHKLANSPAFGVPVLIYYQISRILPQILESSKQAARYLHPQFRTYNNAFSSATNNFQDFFNWFRIGEDYENEIRLRRDPDYRDPHLETIRTAITQFLAEFPDSCFSNLRVERVKKTDGDFNFSYMSSSEKAAFVITKDNQDLEIEQLSSGEKMLLMLVVDIARRLVIANPQLRTQALQQGKGIILIDEIDLHLHPQWQRVVIPGLQKTFPNCQFIVTTHSPQVLSKVKKENILVLEDGQVYQADTYTFGRDSNSILSELMDVDERPIEIKENLKRCFNLIDDGRIEDAKALLQELTDLLGDRDSEVVRAYTLIDFLSRVEPQSK